MLSVSLLHIILLTKCLVIISFDSCTAVKYFVSPSLPPNHDCRTNQPCYTLDQYIRNDSLFSNHSNISLVFLNGKHSCSEDWRISNIEYLQMVALNSQPAIDDPLVQIQASQYCNIVIHNATSVIVERIRVLYIPRGDCLSVLFYLSSRLIKMDQFSSQNVDIEVFSLKATTFTNCENMNNTVCINISSCDPSNVTISKSNFVNSGIYFTIQTCNTNTFSNMQNTCTGLGSNMYQIRSVITVKNCNFSFSPKSSMEFDITNGGFSLDVSVYNSQLQFSHDVGLSFKLRRAGNLRVNLTKCTVRNNSIGLQIFPIESYSCLLFIFDCVFSGQIKTGIVMETSKHPGVTVYFKIYNSSFISNGRGGVYVNSAHIGRSTFIFENSVFDSNWRIVTGLVSGGVSLFTWDNNSVVLLKNVSFVHNHDYSETKPIILRVVNQQNITIEDCTFKDNKGRTLYAYDSKLTFSGTVLFANNIADTGGALSLVYSTVLFSNHSLVTFENNTAQTFGGGVYVNPPAHIKLVGPYASVTCFYQFNIASSSDLNNLNVSINFIDNHAMYGGEDIYYGRVVYDLCAVTDTVRVNNFAFMNTLINFEGSRSNSSMSPISSIPRRICLCNKTGIPQCAEMSYIFVNERRYPGERFRLSLVSVGYGFGSVTSSVYASLLNSHSGSIGSNRQHSQAVNFKQCTQVEYSIHSSSNSEVLVLTANEASVELYGNKRRIRNNIKTFKNQNIINSGLLNTPVYVSIVLDDCPLGFSLTGDNLPSCECHQSLVQMEIRDCVIVNRTGLIYRSGRVWLNASFNGNESDGVVVHKQCPNDYCREQNVSVDLRYPDVQCALNHSGILCGGCSPNLSLALGSNQCLSCLNSNHLSLLIFFAAAGILLVIFIKVLDLTVAKGTINGLIFYANIVWAYQGLLFPAHVHKEPVLLFLLAWLNLDFGIETCFFDGLNAYWKTWLQFAFPIYVWVIVGFMIVSSHYFTLAAKIFGNNSVPVLATLFLLSYAKLVRTIITVLGFAVLHYPNRTSVVWSYDGNLSYFGLEHSFILIAALLALLLLWLPYVTTLLLVPWLKRKAHLKPLRWINRWKPFYDAYYGPLHDKHQYWIGLLLVLRGVLFILLAATSNTVPRINLLALVLVSTALLLFNSVTVSKYKKWSLSLVENSFFYNLVFLSVGMFYQELTGGPRTPIVYTSTVVVYVTFLGIIIYHTVSRIKALSCNRRRHSRRASQELREPTNVRKSVVDPAIREPLLESLD